MGRNVSHIFCIFSLHTVPTRLLLLLPTFPDQISLTKLHAVTNEEHGHVVAHLQGWDVVALDAHVSTWMHYCLFAWHALQAALSLTF